MLQASSGSDCVRWGIDLEAARILALTFTGEAPEVEHVLCLPALLWPPGNDWARENGFWADICTRDVPNTESTAILDRVQIDMVSLHRQGTRSFLQKYRYSVSKTIGICMYKVLWHVKLLEGNDRETNNWTNSHIGKVFSVQPVPRYYKQGS